MPTMMPRILQSPTSANIIAGWRPLEGSVSWTRPLSATPPALSPNGGFRERDRHLPPSKATLGSRPRRERDQVSQTRKRLSPMPADGQTAGAPDGILRGPGGAPGGAGCSESPSQTMRRLFIFMARVAWAQPIARIVAIRILPGYQSTYRTVQAAARPRGMGASFCCSRTAERGGTGFIGSAAPVECSGRSS